MKAVVAVLWAALLAGAVWAWLRSGIALAETPDLIDRWLSAFGVWRAGLIYILLYTVRPLVLFPASLLTVASGLVFGPALGIVFTIVGENASANVAFALARWLGRDWVGARQSAVLRGWDERIRQNAITSVLLMRLVYLPFDAVSYGCGLTSMTQREFAIGSFIGILPGLVSFVLLGGAAASGVEDRLLVLASAVVFFVIGIAIARRLRSRVPSEAER